MLTKNEKQEWEKLATSFNLSDFRKIENGYSHQPVDGTDEEIYIETATSKDSIINGEMDKENYFRIKPFIELLYKIKEEKK